MAEYIELITFDSATLLLLGSDGAVTDFHFDRTEAVNELWAITYKGKCVERGKVYARWVFIHPVGVAEAERHLRTLCPEFESFSSSKVEALEKIEGLIRLVGLHPRTGVFPVRRGRPESGMESIGE